MSNAQDPGQHVQRRKPRRRRTVTLALAGAATAAVIGTTVVSAVPDASPDQQPPVAAPEPEPEPKPADQPPGMRLVGLDHAAVAVPLAWSTNVTHCGKPKEDTVIIDVGVIPACDHPRPEGAESVEVSQGGPRVDFTADETLHIDGVPAQRQATTCRPDDGVTICAGAVYIPSMEVTFRAESSTSAADVDRILDRVRIVPDRVGVPGYRVINSDLLDQGRAGELYLEALRDAGLVPKIRTERASAIDPGYVLDATPGPGTMLQPGDVVRVTVAAEPQNPADEVSIGMSSRTDAGGGRKDDLDDAQIRAGGIMELAVGDRIWTYGHHVDGNLPTTLAGELDGSSLAVDESGQGWSNLPSWVAVAPGRTTITLTVAEGGDRYVVGVVTVNVSRNE